MRYIAVFKTLSYASKVKNEFSNNKKPETIKTPKSVKGGCSYALMFDHSKFDDMSSAVNKHKKGFIGFFKETQINVFEPI